MSERQRLILSNGDVLPGDKCPEIRQLPTGFWVHCIEERGHTNPDARPDAHRDLRTGFLWDRSGRVA